MEKLNASHANETNLASAKTPNMIFNFDSVKSRNAYLKVLNNPNNPQMASFINNSNMFVAVNGAPNGTVVFGKYNLTAEQLGEFLSRNNLIPEGVQNIYTISCYDGLQQPFTMKNGITIQSLHSNGQPIYSFADVDNHAYTQLQSGGNPIINANKELIGNYTSDIQMVTSPERFNEFLQQTNKKISLMKKQKQFDIQYYQNTIDVIKNMTEDTVDKVTMQTIPSRLSRNDFSKKQFKDYQRAVKRFHKFNDIEHSLSMIPSKYANYMNEYYKMLSKDPIGTVNSIFAKDVDWESKIIKNNYYDNNDILEIYKLRKHVFDKWAKDNNYFYTSEKEMLKYMQDDLKILTSQEAFDKYGPNDDRFYTSQGLDPAEQKKQLEHVKEQAEQKKQLEHVKEQAEQKNAATSSTNSQPKRHYYKPYGEHKYKILRYTNAPSGKQAGFVEYVTEQEFYEWAKHEISAGRDPYRLIEDLKIPEHKIKNKNDLKLEHRKLEQDPTSTHTTTTEIKPSNSSTTEQSTKKIVKKTTETTEKTMSKIGDKIGKIKIGTVGKIGAVAGGILLAKLLAGNDNDKDSKENQRNQQQNQQQLFAEQIAKDISTYRYGKKMTGFNQG